MIPPQTILVQVFHIGINNLRLDKLSRVIIIAAIIVIVKAIGQRYLIAASIFIPRFEKCHHLCIVMRKMLIV